MTLKQKHTAPESYIKIPMLCVKSGPSIDLCYSVSRNCRVDLHGREEEIFSLTFGDFYGVKENGEYCYE